MHHRFLIKCTHTQKAHLTLFMRNAVVCGIKIFTQTFINEAFLNEMITFNIDDSIQ